jgi:hypothetical protein
MIHGYTEPSDKAVWELIDQFRSGWIQIPEVQRDVVWDDEKVLKLYESIQSDYPCGSLILWEPTESGARLICDLVRPEILDSYRRNDPKYRPHQFLVDGQQRLTALTALAYGSGYISQREPEAEYDWPRFYVNLRRPADAKPVDPEDKQPKFPWVPMEEFYDGSYVHRPEFSTLDVAARDQAQTCRDRFRSYKFPVQVVKGFDYATVGEVFARVNSEGTPLTGAEIHIARIIPRWRGITREFRAFLREVRAERNYELSLDFLIRCLTVLYTDGPRISKFSEAIAEGEVSRRELDKLWRRCKAGTLKLIGLLEKHGFQDRSRYFTSKNVLVPLLYYVSHEDAPKSRWKPVIRFFYLAQLGEHYSGGTEGVLRGDMKEMLDNDRIADGLLDLCDNARADARRERRLKGFVLPRDEISGLPSKNPVLTLMYAVLRRAGAKDFGLGTDVPLHRVAPDEMQVHHIFPAEVLRTDKHFQQYCRDEELKPSEVSALINDAANLTFISKKQNVSIGAGVPSQYLSTVTRLSNLKAHFVPTDRDLWRTPNYLDFLDARRRLLAKAINSYLRSLK